MTTWNQRPPSSLLESSQHTFFGLAKARGKPQKFQWQTMPMKVRRFKTPIWNLVDSIIICMDANISQYISLNYIIAIIRCVIVYSVSFCMFTYDSVWLCNLYVNPKTIELLYLFHAILQIPLYCISLRLKLYTWNLPCFFLYPSAMDISYHANLVPSQTSSRQVAPNKAESLHFQQRHHC